MDPGRADLEAALARQPRVPLAHVPTPLHPLRRLSEALGREIWVKRDDMTGLAFGGNKTRQLEYLFADILASGADTVVAGAYTQSNWCRQMAAACARLGLSLHLILLHGQKGAKLQGNLLLDRLMGAEVEIVDLDTMEKLQPLIDQRADELRRRGREVYVVEPLGLRANVLGALGYVRACLELAEQIEASGTRFHHLYNCGANMQPAGLALGLEALRLPLHLVTVSPIRWSIPRGEDIARIANATAEHLGLSVRVTPHRVSATEDYIGPEYGVFTDAAREALFLCARLEGLILDPVYTAKAMAGLVDHIRKGLVREDERVIFLHSGGTPALFAYAEDLGLA
ncbi:MAG: D-cysteine desulfhydrase family protein [Geminicoccaceae bacterium]|nr:D-cysteine desulfhydrase family protein [Geminicoccaceae bacterium]MDW8342072.1 D-cysteine desulfhydrase family protein [Geminicoccaceae bacterium]